MAGGAGEVGERQETRGQGDKETRRQGDKETRRQGDKEIGRRECRRQEARGKRSRLFEEGVAMKRMLLLGMLVLALMVIAGCAAGPNELARSPREGGKVAGFWLGLWHGFISPFTFVASLFVDDVGIYEVHNNGGWYNFGFLLGAAAILGGSGGGAARTRKSGRTN